MLKSNVLVVGFPKSGTTSIHNAFVKSGITSYHQHIDGKNQIGDYLYRNYLNTGNIFSSFSNYIAVTQADYIQESIAVYPQLDYNLLLNTFKQDDVKFILNYRNPKKIIDSFNRWHNNARKRLTDANAPGLPSGFGSKDVEMERWITDHYTFLRDTFSHNEEKFLEIDIESHNVQNELSKFLSVDIKWWGQANANK